ncbi:MAG: ATP-binding protein [bacterium]|nr:ATP-binding protein [bacterium]
MFLLFGVITVVAALLSLSLLVFIRNPHSSVNRTFSAFSSLLALWLAANFIGSNFKSWSASALFIYLDFLLGPFVGLLFVYFVCSFRLNLTRVKTNKNLLRFVTIATLICSSIILIPNTIEINSNFTDKKIIYGDLYEVYSVILGAIFIVGIIILLKAWKFAKGSARKQLRLLTISLLTAVLFVSFANLVVPQITDSIFINLTVGNLAYISIAALIATTAFTIIKHKLFDIRPIVARSFAYIFALTALGSLYGFVAFVLLDNIVFHTTTTGVTQRITYTLLALLFGLSFAPAKRLFDRLSNRLFYRDAFDPQMFIDSFTNILVTNMDIAKLIDKSNNLISQNLKPSHLSFYLVDQDNVKAIGINSSKNESDLIKQHIKEIYTLDQKVIVTDEFENQQFKSMRRTFLQKDISLIVKLTSHSELIGLLVVGIKQSGNIYNSEDISIFEIIADELSLAVQNSLRYEEIKGFNLTLQGKVDNATKQLRHTNEKLKALDESKDEFISMASHQLRTPLTSVKGYLSMVIDGDAGKLNEQQEKLLNQAFFSSQRMVYLISDLLNVSRLKTGKFVIEATSVSLPNVIESEMAQIQETAASRKLTLQFNKPTDFPLLRLDEMKTRQVIMNFIDNAIYYTPAEGHIDIVLESTPQSVEFKVIDNGLGVPKHVQHQLFGKFFRAENAKRARPDGTGLGLFMAKKVVIAQGGAIIFHSQEGKGSTFGFSFPRSAIEVRNQT